VSDFSREALDYLADLDGGEPFGDTIRPVVISLDMAGPDRSTFISRDYFRGADWFGYRNANPGQGISRVPIAGWQTAYAERRFYRSRSFVGRRPRARWEVGSVFFSAG
jgi:hypothetical protein